MHIRTLVGILAASAILAGARPALAQEKGAANFGIGYSNRTTFTNGTSLNWPTGWLASVGVGAAPKAAFVAEVGGHYKSGRKTHTFQGGVRFFNARNPKATPFFQVVTGLAHDAAFFQNAWTLTPGAGFDAKINDSCAVRIQADWMLMRSSGTNVNGLRVGMGLVFGMPRK